MNWSLGLASWIIQDGNYGDFRCGQRIEVAVEFAFKGDPSLSPASPSAVQCDASLYDLTGRVVLTRPDVWVIDVGILVFNEAPPPQDVAVGDVVSGLAYLGVDPFFYFERLSKLDEMPALVYSWHVHHIHMQTAPFIKEGRVIRRDAAKLGWRSVAETNAWVDDEGRADYVLECELLPVAPLRETSTAT